jgi:hypothetical protein
MRIRIHIRTANRWSSPLRPGQYGPMGDHCRTADGWSVEVVQPRGTPGRHDGEWIRIRHLGWSITDTRSIAELERWVSLAALPDALAGRLHVKPDGLAAAPPLPLPGSCSGRYQTDPHPSARRRTVKCPGPLARSARAVAQSHGGQPTLE